MKICFISKNIYPVVSDNGANFAGGAEIQLLTLARKFQDIGHTVEFITDDFGQPHVDVLSGIKYYKVPFRYMGGNKLYLFSDWFKFYRELKKIDADVYIMKGPRFNIFIAGLFGVNAGKRVVFIATIDTDSDPNIMCRVDPLYTRFLYRLGLRLIPVVVCQTVQQKANFRKYFCKESVHINNIYCLDHKVSQNKNKKTVLWVGTKSSAKRPWLFLDFARRLNDIQFKMAMVPSENHEEQKKFEIEISKVTNIEYLGFVPEGKMEKLYDEARVLINFSKLEGFPNVFLHAWARRTPVVSLMINPDAVIDKYRMGFCSGTMRQMIKDVRMILENDQLRKEMGDNGYQYVQEEHNSDRIAEQYIRLFEKVS